MSLAGFSVVIPTYARAQQLNACLEGFSRVRYGRNHFEIIIVDDGSPEAPDPAICHWRDGLDIRVFRQANAGPAAARNAGARLARFKYLAFIDDDCVPHPEWLAELGRAFDAAPRDLIGGRTVNVLADNSFSAVSQELVAYLCEYFDGQNGRTRLFTSNNMAVPADEFRAIGGFDTRFRRAAGEDRELCDRWISQGRGTAFAADAMVMHAHELTLRSFWRQHFAYGRGAASFRVARARRDGEPVRLEPLRFYAGMLRRPFHQGVSPRAMQRAALLLLAQIANVAGFLTSLHRLKNPERRNTG